jgi:hypothetical protein
VALARGRGIQLGTSGLRAHSVAAAGAAVPVAAAHANANASTSAASSVPTLSPSNSASRNVLASAWMKVRVTRHVSPTGSHRAQVSAPTIVVSRVAPTTDAAPPAMPAEVGEVRCASTDNA